MQTFKFFQADNKFQRLLIKMKPICYLMSYMQICKNSKFSDNMTKIVLKIIFGTVKY